MGKDQSLLPRRRNASRIAYAHTRWDSKNETRKSWCAGPGRLVLSLVIVLVLIARPNLIHKPLAEIAPVV